MKLVRRFKDGFLMLCLAKRRSGKTTFMSNMLKQQWIEEFGENNIYLIYPDIFTPNNQYSYLDINEQNLMDNYDEEVLVELVRRQKSKKKHGTAKKILIILDDCLSEDNFAKNGNNGILSTIAVRGRHDLISVVISSQYITGMNTKLRANADYALVWKLYGKAYHHVSEHFRPTRDRKDFETYLDDLKKYEFILIDYVDMRLWKYLVNEKKFKLLLNF